MRERPRLLAPAAFAAVGEGAVVLDVRPPIIFGAAHIPGAVNVDLHGPQFPALVSLVVPKESPLMLVVSHEDDLEYALAQLAAAGYSHVLGALDGGMDDWERAGLATLQLRQISVHDLHELLPSPDVTMLDVREQHEWNAGHIAGAVHLPLDRLARHVDEIPHHSSGAVICARGQYSAVAASVLQAAGHEDVRNVVGGMRAWLAAGYETCHGGTSMQTHTEYDTPSR